MALLQSSEHLSFLGALKVALDLLVRQVWPRLVKTPSQCRTFSSTLIKHGQ
jgi:hypothetical protein